MPSILYQDLVLHSVPRLVVDSDTKVILQYELEQTQRNFGLSTYWPENKKLASLVTKAAGLFIFASIVYRYVRGLVPSRPTGASRANLQLYHGKSVDDEAT